MDFEVLIKQGKLAEALEDLKQTIRKRPANGDLRSTLFQLYCVMGEWDRARTQLDVLGDMSGECQLLAKLYSQAIICEKLRSSVFAGKKVPMIFGEPAEWVASLVQALGLSAQNETEAAAKLVATAYDQAPTTAGAANGQAFDWIMDMDSRLGPVLEIFVNGTYYWMPYSALQKLTIAPPSHLIDFVWISAALTLTNGTAMTGLIPVRYPGTETCPDTTLQLAKRTDWEGAAENYYYGKGQRMLCTNDQELAILDLRELTLTATN